MTRKPLMLSSSRRGISLPLPSFYGFCRWHLSLSLCLVDHGSFLHATGIYLFTKGFLLTRLVLENKSSCSQPPVSIRGEHGDCWLTKSFDKAVILIIDALRYDFTIPHDKKEHYLNSFRVLHETAVKSPENAFLLPFIADPPTTTLQRLKGLTTGTLPTFIDASSNFGGTAIDEDNLVAQLRNQNKTLVHLGDDTWHSLFPGYFDANLTHAYDSFNVWDLHTVDNGVTEHLLPLIRGKQEWDVVFGHFLGVDHAGHRYGPDHPAMATKLQQMDKLIRDVIEGLDDRTLLVVMGDHGMDAKGDHGGESDDEIEAALWMYSKKKAFGRSDPTYVQPPSTAKVRPVGQIDLVPTLALLLGLPIPFNNLGAPIEEAFIGRDGKESKRLAFAQALTAFQIHKYQQEYFQLRGLDERSTLESERLWSDARNLWDDLQTTSVSAVSRAFSKYQQGNLRVCKSLWARFDVPSMARGISILALTLAALIFFASSGAKDRPALIPIALRRIGVFGIFGVALAIMLGFAYSDISAIDISLFGASLGSLLGYTSVFTAPLTLPSSLWTWLSILFTGLQSIGFASNSFTIWEDEISLFFLGTFGALALMSSSRQFEGSDRILGAYHSVIFLVISRLASLSSLCREEQIPMCKSTFYASETSSTSATWQLLIPYVIAIVLPSIIKSYYRGTKSYEGSAAFWIGACLRIGLLGSAVYWTLDAADNGEWFPSLSTTAMSRIKTTLAQFVLALAFGAGTATFIWAPPCVRVETSATASDDTQVTRFNAQPKSITILGYANVHGSRFALLYTAWLLAASLVSKPMGSGTLALMTWQLFSLLEILDTNGLTPSPTSTLSPIGPAVAALLGSFYYFKTGHQATLASIHWDAAFIPLTTVQYPWSPLIVVLNTYAAQILAAIFVPLLVLWKQPPPGSKKSMLGTLNDVCGALAAFFSHFAVQGLATTMWAGWLRRHLMLFRIFNPRFLMGAAVLLVVELVGIFFALGLGIWYNVSSIAEVFGWGP